VRRRHKFAILILCLGAIIYYLFPFFFSFGILPMALLLLINPIYCFIFSLLYAIRFGLRIWFPLVMGALFLPASVLFYSPVYLLYAAGYACVALLGCCLGYPVYKRYE